MEGENSPQIQPAAQVVRMHPSRKKHLPCPGNDGHPKVEMPIVEAGNQLVVALRLDRKYANLVRRIGAIVHQTKRHGQNSAYVQQKPRPSWKVGNDVGRAPRRQVGIDNVAVEEIASCHAVMQSAFAGKFSSGNVQCACHRLIPFNVPNPGPPYSDMDIRAGDVSARSWDRTARMWCNHCASCVLDKNYLVCWWLTIFTRRPSGSLT